MLTFTGDPSSFELEKVSGGLGPVAMAQGTCGAPQLSLRWLGQPHTSPGSGRAWRVIAGARAARPRRSACPRAACGAQAWVSGAPDSTYMQGWAAARSHLAARGGEAIQPPVARVRGPQAHSALHYGRCSTPRAVAC